MKNNFTVFFALLICSSLMHASQSDLRKSTSPRPAVLKKEESTPRLYSVEDKVEQLITDLGNLKEQLNSGRLDDKFVSEGLELHATSIARLQTKVDQAASSLSDHTTSIVSLFDQNNANSDILTQQKNLIDKLHQRVLALEQEEFPTLTNTVQAHQQQLEALRSEIDTLKSQSVTTSNRDVASEARSEESLHDVSALIALRQTVTAYESRIAALEKINTDAHAATRKAQAERKKSVNRARAFFVVLATSGTTYYVATYTQRGQQITAQAIDGVQGLWPKVYNPIAAFCAGLFASAPVAAAIVEGLQAPSDSAQPETTEVELATAPVEVQTTELPTAE